LVQRAAAAGVSVLGVADHDTVAACGAAAAACERAGIEFVPGIEMTAVAEGADVHVLGYFIDVRSTALEAFLVQQRRLRVERVLEMIRRLAEHGIVIAAETIVETAASRPGTSVGRPWIARALVEGGHVADTNEAFDRWLARGRPAFVPRTGASPAEVIARIHEADGIASLAHPVLIGRDEWIAEFAAAGLDALEAYHSDHDAIATNRYLLTAERLGLAISGGSDYHGDEAHGPVAPGAVTLPPERFEALKRLATSRATASPPTTSS
jgi:hypothetical protein